jgi:hypothetical protein
MLRVLATALLLPLALSACGNFFSVYREFSVSSKEGAPKSIAIDVKQRTILSGSPDGEKIIVCAEPSPDALSVYAAGLSGSAFAGDKKALDLALTGSETGSFIGNRTETIQLLRDNLYRACEAHMNGAMGDGDYIRLIRRYQIMTMGLLAIERLTDTVKPASVTLIAGQASAGTGVSQEALEQLSTKKAKTDAELVASKAALDDAKKAYDAAKSASDAAPADGALATKLATAKKDYDAAVKKVQLDEATQKIAAQEYEEGKAKTGHSAIVGGGSAVFGPEAAKAQAQAASAIAAAAQEIVRMTIDDGFKIEDCFNRSEGCRITDQVRALETATAACGDIADDDNANRCTAPILGQAGVPPGGAYKVLQSIQDASPQEQRLLFRGGVSLADMVRLAERTANAPTTSLYRIDIFAVSARQSEQQQVFQAIASARLGTPRRREISPEDCKSKFAIDANTTASVRYDDIDTEVAKKDQVVALLKGLKMTVSASRVVTPTPLYLSVFLCN